MQVLITHGAMARTRAVQLSRFQLLGALAAVCLVITLLSGSVYHFVFLKAAREGWPVVSQIVRLVVRDEIEQRDRFMRENLDAMAQRVGEMQAKLVRLEAMGERVSSMAGLKPDDLKLPKVTQADGKGGPFVPATTPSLEQLQRTIGNMDASADLNTDLFMFTESRLLEVRLKSLLVPNTKPVDGPVGSGFGFRSDPFTSRAALHTGLDFPADHGTPIVASAGGLVVTTEWHPEYGHVVEIDHGNGLSTRYAHCSKVLVSQGALVKRGQLIAEVGNSGRSTGAHLHFEVLVDGVPQDPARFLGGGNAPEVTAGARHGKR
jgi:murein DD-endopeptidase MepM/ murein hydrolase activator NlpD